MKSVTLYFTQGSSDKAYQVNLTETEGGYNVSCANAKRGQALNHKVKNKEPLTIEKAEKVFESTIKSKAKKGYTTDLSGTPFSGVDMNGEICEGSNLAPTQPEHSGIELQLLNETYRREATAYCHNPGYIAQQKHDGERRCIERTGDEIRGTNKKGFYTMPIPAIQKSALNIECDSYVIDGEDMGGMLWAFDLLEMNGKDISKLPYIERYNLLKKLAGNQEHIKVVETAFTTEEKLNLLKRIKAKDLEGIVFKRASETYSVGKGGDQFKFKFFAETSVIVNSISSTKRSVGMAVMEEGKKILVGSCTIPPNADIPEINSIIEVKYLYAYKGGSLFTTSFLKPRNDVDAVECDISRLKYKPEAIAA